MRFNAGQWLQLSGGLVLNYNVLNQFEYSESRSAGREDGLSRMTEDRDMRRAGWSERGTCGRKMSARCRNEETKKQRQNSESSL